MVKNLVHSTFSFNSPIIDEYKFFEIGIALANKKKKY